MIADAIARVQQQLTIDAVEESYDDGGSHWLIGCYRAPTGFYTISCSCGWASHSGKAAAAAHALLRSHNAGHRDATATDGR